MTAPRYNIYGFIHKGLRARMTETLLLLGRMDCEDAQSLRTTLGQVNDLLDLCQGHLEHENRFVHPAMEAVQPGSADGVAREHAGHERAIDQLRTGLFEVENGSGADQEQAAGRLYRQLAVFVAENLEHMHHEETANNRVLWSGYSDEELHHIEQAIVDSQPQEQKAMVLGLMIPALSPSERAQLLDGMRRGVPPNVFQGVLLAVQQMLSPGDWQKLERALA